MRIKFICTFVFIFGAFVQKSVMAQPQGITLVPASNHQTFIIKLTDGDSIPTGGGNGLNNRLLLRDDRTQKIRILAISKIGEKQGDVVASISNPQFSADRKKVYFQSAYAAVTGSIHVVDLKTGKEHFVCAGNAYTVEKSGPWVGDIIVMMHKYNGPPQYGSYDHRFVVNDQGQELKDLGE